MQRKMRCVVSIFTQTAPFYHFTFNRPDTRCNSSQPCSPRPILSLSFPLCEPETRTPADEAIIEPSNILLYLTQRPVCATLVPRFFTQPYRRHGTRLHTSSHKGFGHKTILSNPHRNTHGDNNPQGRGYDVSLSVYKP